MFLRENLDGISCKAIEPATAYRNRHGASESLSQSTFRTASGEAFPYVCTRQHNFGSCLFCAVLGSFHEPSAKPSCTPHGRLGNIFAHP